MSLSYLKRLSERIDSENVASGLPCKISMSIGLAEYDHSVPCTVEELMSRADQLMYAQKKGKKDSGKG